MAVMCIICLIGYTADRAGAGSTLLGIEVTEAVEAVGEVVPRGKALPRQLLFAARA